MFFVKFNLLYVSALTTHSQVNVNFYLNHCDILDQHTQRMMIGRGERVGGLYVLDTQA